MLIGGGAPNSTLIAGALLAFLDQGVEFDVISTSGAGALMGLLYMVPEGGDRRGALERWVEAGVSDEIYQFFPVNYKVFMKPGNAADIYRQSLAALPFTRPFFNAFADDSPSGAHADWLRLMLACWSPTALMPQSLGLCAPLPFAEQAIDFEALRQLESHFYINAYNVTQSRMQIWDKDEITADHIRAAFAFPFIYPPYRIGADDYIEGAAIQPINFGPLVSDSEASPGLHRDLDTLVIFDILGSEKLIRTPRNLYDAWVQSIITPLVALSKQDIRLFELEHNIDYATGQPRRRLLKVDLMGDIAPEHWPEVTDWSASNLRRLFDIGYRAGLAFCYEHAAVLNADESEAPPHQQAA
ncbi:patatin-like phospholipase family protein [Cupriavidus necator]|uniref:patatin-like phospholipase family protein n=1 Tax=Cupriavidus necator TaxID=106590 RepID=UPI001D00D611|nr:patatin-like phospholipase family protein [Cupriavidus necator]